MPDKKPISLVISDIDNTIADKFRAWGHALDVAMNGLSALYGRDRNDIAQDLLAHVPDEMRYVSGPYVGKDLRSDVAATPSLKPTSPEMEKKLEKIFHEWDKNKNCDKLYEGVAATINKIKSSGAKFVLYTDSRESVCVPRLAKMGITADMLDGLYVIPDLKNGKAVRKPVSGKAAELRKALGKKLVILEPKTNKPNVKNMKRILNDMGVKDPSTAVMVGDNIRADGTAAITLKMNYAWQAGGTVIDDVTLGWYKMFCQNKKYKLTTADHLEQMNNTNRPTEILESFKDLNKYYRFTTPEKALEAKAQSKSVKKINPAVIKRVINGRLG